ncbi:MAG: TolB family protein, partial [Acidobacteria bacterium]|nr:TolB family protein [Acidobacteriota bacterium]
MSGARLIRLTGGLVAVTTIVATVFFAQAPVALTGMRDPAFAPDGRRIAVSWLEHVWTMTPDGRDAKRVVTTQGEWISERDPAWSPDGKHIAFAADTNGSFDVYIAPATGGAARKVTSLPGDERWPSWTRDGRLLISHRDGGPAWHLATVNADGTGTPTKVTPDDNSEWFGRVSPDGKRVVFLSDRDLETGDTVDVFVRALDGTGSTLRVTTGGGFERWPSWAPDSARVSFAASRTGQGAGVWVADVSTPGGAPAGGRAGGPAGRGGGGGGAQQPLTQLASRYAGFSAWSPDGQTMMIATEPAPGGAYNGNPERNDDDAPAAFMEAGTLRLWRVDAPRALDGGARA